MDVDKIHNSQNWQRNVVLRLYSYINQICIFCPGRRRMLCVLYFVITLIDAKSEKEIFFYGWESKTNEMIAEFGHETKSFTFPLEMPAISHTHSCSWFPAYFLAVNIQFVWFVVGGKPRGTLFPLNLTSSLKCWSELANHFHSNCAHCNWDLYIVIAPRCERLGVRGECPIFGEILHAQHTTVCSDWSTSTDGWRISQTFSFGDAGWWCWDAGTRVVERSSCHEAAARETMLNNIGCRVHDGVRGWADAVASGACIL